MDKQEKREIIQSMKKEAWITWLLFFIFQLIIGAYSLFSAHAELLERFPDMGFWLFTLILTTGSALIATVLLIVYFLLLFVIGACIIGFMMWRESRRN